MGVPGLVIVDTALAYARGWRFFSRLDFACFLVFAAVFVMGLAAWWIRPLRALITRKRGQLALLAGALVLVLGVIEISLYVFGAGMLAAQQNLRAPHQHFVFRPRQEIMPGVYGESHYGTNGRALRSGPRDAAYRIFCIGGRWVFLLDDWGMAAPGRAILFQSGQARKVWVGNAHQRSNDDRPRRSRRNL